MIVTLICQSSR